MNGHLFKLVWNRKRANAPILLEIAFSFLVVFAVATLGLFLWNNSGRPLGFDWRPVWTVRLDMKNAGDFELGAEQRAILQQVIREARALPQVEAVALSSTCPYGDSNWTEARKVHGREIESDVNHVSFDFDRVFATRIVAGRWFQAGDEKLAWRPVVIDADLARAAFGAADPIGKRLGDPKKDEPEDRVIGMVADFRKEGELGRAHNTVLFGESVESGWKTRPDFLLVRTRPGTTAAFEGDLIRRLQAVAPSWSFEPKPLAQLRHDHFQNALLPLVIGGLIAFFLLLMVGLGLLGVLWQNVLRRTRELGLRRAVGAPRSAVHAQVVGEQLMVTTFGVLVGVVVVAQLPFTGVVGFLGAGVYVSGLVVAVVALYALGVLCAFYPSLLAGRVPPADALRYE